MLRLSRHVRTYVLILILILLIILSFTLNIRLRDCSKRLEQTTSDDNDVDLTRKRFVRPEYFQEQVSSALKVTTRQGDVEAEKRDKQQQQLHQQQAWELYQQQQHEQQHEQQPQQQANEQQQLLKGVGEVKSLLKRLSLDKLGSNNEPLKIAESEHNLQLLPVHNDVTTRGAWFDGVVKGLADRQAPVDDQEVIALARALLRPPPPPNLLPKLSRRMRATPQASEIDRILGEKTNGFFVECGAYDGEVASNSLYFENVRNWTGLLIEVDPAYYHQMVGKRRKAWTINACLSPVNHFTMLVFKADSKRGQLGKMIITQAHAGQTTRREGGVANGVPNAQEGGSSSINSPSDRSAPCFPLLSLLIALNQSSIDYLSLDVEGLELEILETINFEEVDITAMSVEYVNSVRGRGAKDAYVNAMSYYGYQTIRELHSIDWETETYVDDLIFLKNRTAAKILQ